MLNYSVLPDLAALAALVFVFRSMLRRHAGEQLGRWLTGWCFVLAYFCVRLFDVGVGTRVRMLHTLAMLLVEMAAIMFLRAASRKDILSEQPVAAAVWTTAMLAYTACVHAGVADWRIYAVVVVLIAASASVLHGRTRIHTTLGQRVFGLAASWVLALALAELIALHHAIYGAEAIMVWLYLMAGIRFAQYWPHRTAGVQVTVFGFFAMAGMHPLTWLLGALIPGLAIEREVWNIPKFITAVGILLTFLEQQIDRAEHLALHDPLTGLPNRRLLEDRMGKILQRADRNRTMAAVLLVDMDEFKRINDTYGHAVGDAVLCAASERMLKRLRKADTVARTGGDEFTVLLSDLTEAQNALALARKIEEELQRPVTVGGVTLQATGSIGVAVYPNDAQSPDALYALADAGMYAAKRRAKTALT
jgi:diguanylate cyclase (GGDEF)-like protein